MNKDDEIPRQLGTFERAEGRPEAHGLQGAPGMSGTRFKKFSRIWWVLASADGCLLAKGHPDPKMLPYHLDAMTDHVPALVAAPNKFTLRDVRRLWNDMVRAECHGRSYCTRNLVHERKVKITIEEAT